MGEGTSMTEYHDHRDDCPFKFATLDVCDCVEKNMLDRIEALTEQLAAARQDAKFAEDELEMQEQEACMMENDYLKLEKERDALEAKLAKAVEIGNKMAHSIEGNYYLPNIAGEWRKVAAEIKGESHE
jgi:hypothetical protein